MEPKELKCWHLDERDNEEENGLDNEIKNGLDKNRGEIEVGRYVPPSVVLFSLFLQKMSNRPSDLSERTKNLKYIICIPKICYSRSANFVLEFLSWESSKVQKISILATWERD